MSIRWNNSIVRTLGFAAIFALPMSAVAQLLGPPAIPGKAESKKKQRRQGADVEWLWQYSPPPEDGREHDLIQDPHFEPFLAQVFTAPQAFWGAQTEPRKTLAATIYDFLAIPGKVLADDNRYISVTGCVFHFCPSRGLMWVDLNSRDTVAAFAAIDWIRESKVTTDPEAEYTLWLFTTQPMSVEAASPNRIPNALLFALKRWAAEPIVRTGIHQRITTAVLVDPDGTPHTLKPADLGIVTTEVTK